VSNGQVFETDDVLAARIRAVEAQLRAPELLVLDELADELSAVAQILGPAGAARALRGEICDGGPA
jgi:hypothetical protein